MTGADEAHYLAASKTSSRIITFPDGKARHITLKNWHWDVLDRLQREKGWPQEEVPSMAFQHALEFCNDPAGFEEQLRKSFFLFVKENMAYVMSPGDWSAANERF